MPIKTFWCEPTGTQKRWLRRFRWSKDGACLARPGETSYHDAQNFIGIAPEIRAMHEDGRSYIESTSHEEFAGDPRWPGVCKCGYVFTPEDQWQVHTRSLYRRLDQPDAEPLPLEELPPGAMWDAWWMGKHWKGADGICLVVKLPDRTDWIVDSRASNCTLPNDNEHKCWCRHGDPRTGDVDVNKNGLTCAAGAGSIQSRGYHGFLRNGYLTD